MLIKDKCMIVNALSIALILIGIVGALSAIVVTPEFATNHLSSDHHISAQGLETLRLFRLWLSLLGILLVITGIFIIKYSDKILIYSLSGSKWNYWLIVTLVYLTLIYSTALHYAYGPERTIRLDYFFYDYVPQYEKYLKRLGTQNSKGGLNVKNVNKYFKDLGILKIKYGLEHKSINYDGYNFWKISSFWEDGAVYIMQTDSIDLSIPPYKYRFLPTTFVKLIRYVTGLNTETSFLYMNIILTAVTALIFTFYLTKYFCFSRMISFIGGILFVTMVSNTRTLPFPIMEPISFFFALLIFISVISKNTPLFILSSLCGVASKEILVFSSILWFIIHFQTECKKSLIKNALISSVPIAGFSLIRIILGGGALEVSYSYNLVRLEFPALGKRIFGISSLIDLLMKIFLSFSFLWTGIINIRKNSFLKRGSIIIPIVIIAAILFSHRITRVVGILFPIIIPMFLLFFNRYQQNQWAV